MSKFFTPYNLPEGHAFVGALPDCLPSYTRIKVREGKRSEHKIHDAGSFGPSRASQSEAADADINVIVARFTKSGVLPAGVEKPMYGDFVDVPDLRESLDMVRTASEKFSYLPAAVRDRFGNDPTRLVEFCLDEKNYDELVKMGLANKRKEPVVPEPISVRVVPDPPKA